MKLFGLDLSKIYQKEVETLNFVVSAQQIQDFGGLDSLGQKVSDLELNLPKGVMNTAFFSQKNPRIRIMYFVKHTDPETIQKWLRDQGIPV